MLNVLLLYSLIASFLLRIYHHRKVIVPGSDVVTLRGVLRWLGKTYVRGVLLVSVGVVGIAQGIPGDGYTEWWVSYSTDHSMVIWFALVVPMTVGLYFIKESTYIVMKKPGKYGYFGDQIPCLHRIDMRVPLFWNTVFWGWTLASPWLPFFNCFVRIFLFRTSVSVVFPDV